MPTEVETDDAVVDDDAVEDDVVVAAVNAATDDVDAAEDVDVADDTVAAEEADVVGDAADDEDAADVEGIVVDDDAVEDDVVVAAVNVAADDVEATEDADVVDDATEDATAGDDVIVDTDRKHVTFTSGTKLRDVCFLMNDAETTIEVAAEGNKNEIGKPFPIKAADSGHVLDKTDSSVQPMQQTQLEPQVPSEAGEGEPWTQAKVGPGGERMPKITS